ncbi:CHAD domain-containing protein [Pleurocapsales cyanobacterium LEGE 10410]|nr:CHAD domain-containing protein [Pleurocapsales cyanobacterium LEGE 10410]
MSYRLKAQESLPKGIKRIATEEVAKAIADFNQIEELGINVAVHQARKRLKKTRAVIRLVRDRLGKKTYKSENARLRDLGRNLANLRDLRVQIETLDNLVAYFDTVEPETFTDIRRELRVDYRQEYQKIVNEDVTKAIVKQLEESKTEIDNWSIGSDDWSTVDKSLKRVYQRGSKALHQVISQPAAENFHDWRKRVKYLRYQLTILAPIWTEVIENYVAQTHHLTDCLGEEHDLAVLQELVTDQPERFNRDNKLSVLTTLIDRRRQELQSTAIVLGQKIYAENPENFVDRIGSYWEIWRASSK